MQTMTAVTAALLKSRSMIGVNRPIHRVTISGGVRVFENLVKIAQGDSSGGKHISNWIETNDNRNMCCWFESGILQTGYSADLDFFTTGYAIESTVSTPGVTIPGGGGVSLYRRADGKILLSVSAISNDSWVKCYISATGNGDDWTYLSTIHVSGYAEELFAAIQSDLSIPCRTSTGRLFITFANGYSQGGYIIPANYGAVSDDDGETWRVTFSDSALMYHPYSPSQPVALPSGEIYFISLANTGHSNLAKSTDNGETFTKYAAELSYDFSDAVRQDVYGLSFYYDDTDGIVYALCGATYDGCGIYRLTNLSPANFEDRTKWEYLFDVQNNTVSGAKIYPMNGYLSFHGDSTDNSWIIGVPPGTKELPCKSISISRTKGVVAAAGANVTADNKGGVYSPDREGAWYQVLWPNAEITIEQGYGTDMMKTFTGNLDGIDMLTFPQEISLLARDKLKLALDQTVTGSTGNHVLIYTNSTVESIFQSLCTFAGITAGTVETTGLAIARKEFGWCSFGDAMQWLAELIGFEIVADELGIVHFRRDWYPDDGTSVYTFQEGVDIISLGYIINDRDLYNTVIVHGKAADGSVIELITPVPGADYWRLPANKILKIDASDCDTEAKLQVIAARAIYLMMSRFRVVRWGCVGVPHIQIGDLVTVIESSTTISEIYRVTDLSSTMDESGYIMEFTAHWYSHGEG